MLMRLVASLNYSRHAVLIGLLLLRLVAWAVTRRPSAESKALRDLPQVSRFEDARQGLSVYSGVSIFGFTVMGIFAAVIFFGSSRPLGFPQPLATDGGRFCDTSFVAVFLHCNLRRGGYQVGRGNWC